MNNKRKSIAAVVVAGVVVALVVSYFSAYDNQDALMQGQIEAQQYFVSAKVPGRIETVLVKKGQQVKQGDPMFVLSTPELDAKLNQAQAGEAAAGAMRQEVDNGARSQQIAAAKDQWLKAKAAAILSEKTYQRINALFRDGVMAEQKRDEAKTAWQAAKYTEQAAFQQYQLAVEGSRKGEKLAAAEKEKMAAAAVAEVQAYLKDAELMAYHDGMVDQVLLHPGELAPAGFPVVTLVDLNNAWALFQVREDNLSQFKQGDVFNVRIPALSKEKTYAFKVSYISVMGDYATWRTTQPGRGYDMRTFQVELRPVEPIEGLRVGMTVLLEAK
ncbi:MAG: HlyD family secretion protein [Plesiomonas sp.]|uniref:HlyD family secretion protein n=1 Tax=Plesiomonas sp. TaxID=2486279 RepID=UPI003F3301F9